MILLDDIVKDDELGEEDIRILATYIGHLNNGNRHGRMARHHSCPIMGERPHMAEYFSRAKEAKQLFDTGQLL